MESQEFLFILLSVSGRKAILLVKYLLFKLLHYHHITDFQPFLFILLSVNKKKDLFKTSTLIPIEEAGTKSGLNFKSARNQCFKIDF